ncbi:hypothetical protein [Xylophilus sp.]|uniref:hypothetical protein n=1 Tax=Xylophilus sp. TaxID=2653893 RepID=UPI002D80E8B8|nr:hypothetical protein [Xylophilus sp.]
MPAWTTMRWTTATRRTTARPPTSRRRWRTARPAACGLAAGAVLPLALAPPVPEAVAAQRPAGLAISAGVIPRGLDRPPKHLLA